MCGIIGGIAERNIAPILLEGLKRLEYRGYDSAGMAIFNSATHHIERVRVLGKVAKLKDSLEKKPLLGHLGIAHTRWATHGEPSERNAHPIMSQQHIAVVHNGIIENYQSLQKKLLALGYQFESETDTEVVGHLIHYHLKQTGCHRQAIQQALSELKGAYALGIIFADLPTSLFATCHGSPLVIGIGIQEHFIASDPIALLPVTQQFIYLEEGDLVELTQHHIHIENKENKTVERPIHVSTMNVDQTSKGVFRHYMQKEIYEQQQALADTLQDHLPHWPIKDTVFGYKASEILPKIARVHIIACGTSYHAGLVAGYWLESLAHLPCRVEVASEFRYRTCITEPDTLFIALSQSGETADTLAALRKAKALGKTLAICNTAHSSLVREADLAFITSAGTEIGVAATKTFTAQLAALLLLALTFAQYRSSASELSSTAVQALKNLPTLAEQFVALDFQIEQIAHDFTDVDQALFLARGMLYPIALEGALKLKEISYVHAEGYPAGELKHGPLALVDNDMPIIILAPNNDLSNKLQSNIKEVETRGGRLYIFSDDITPWQSCPHITCLSLPKIPDIIAPILYVIPLQFLAYHVAVLKGTDVDQPRNLAKSVTVE